MLMRVVQIVDDIAIARVTCWAAHRFSGDGHGSIADCTIDDKIQVASYEQEALLHCLCST